MLPNPFDFVKVLPFKSLNTGYNLMYYSGVRVPDYGRMNSKLLLNIFKFKHPLLGVLGFWGL